MIVLNLFPFIVALCLCAWGLCRICVFGVSAIWGIQISSALRDMIVIGVPLGVLAVTVMRLIM